MIVEARRPVVLVVDADEHQREIARVLLEGHGFDVRLAPDGEAGLKMLEDAPADLVLVDVNLPGIDGWSMCEAVRMNAELGGAPVVVTSLHEIDRRRIASSGCAHFVPKPWTTRELVETLRTLLPEELRPPPRGGGAG